MTRLFKKLKGFLWDKGNERKNEVKHGVSAQEAEETFFDSRYVLLKDSIHSNAEQRFQLIGKTKLGRLLTLAFTVCGSLVRIISARPASRKERIIYEKASQNAKI